MRAGGLLLVKLEAELLEEESVARVLDHHVSRMNGKGKG